MEIRGVQTALMNERCLMEYVKNLLGDSESSKQNTYLLLRSLMSKANQVEEG